VRIDKVMFSDELFLFELRNEPDVRSASWNAKPVKWEDHVKWLRASLVNVNCSFFILRSDEGCPVGQVRYDVSCKSAEVGISVSSRNSGNGYATRGLQETAILFFQNYPRVQTIFAHIKHDNIASLKIFAKAGYSPPVRVNYEGHDCLEMILNRPQ